MPAKKKEPNGESVELEQGGTVSKPPPCLKILSVPLTVNSRWPNSESYTSEMIGLTQVVVEPCGDPMTYPVRQVPGQSLFDAYMVALEEFGRLMWDLQYRLREYGRTSMLDANIKRITNANNAVSSEPPNEDLF